jgi:hypothetical protein
MLACSDTGTVLLKKNWFRSLPLGNCLLSSITTVVHKFGTSAESCNTGTWNAAVTILKFLREVYMTPPWRQLAVPFTRLGVALCARRELLLSQFFEQLRVLRTACPT